MNDQSNVATPAGGIMVGVLVLLSLQFLTSAFEYIPAATLGAVIIMAASQMFDWKGHFQKQNRKLQWGAPEKTAL